MCQDSVTPRMHGHCDLKWPLVFIVVSCCFLTHTICCRIKQKKQKGRKCGKTKKALYKIIITCLLLSRSSVLVVCRCLLPPKSHDKILQGNSWVLSPCRPWPWSVVCSFAGRLQKPILPQSLPLTLQIQVTLVKIPALPWILVREISFVRSCRRLYLVWRTERVARTTLLSAYKLQQIRCV